MSGKGLSIWVLIQLQISSGTMMECYLDQQPSMDLDQLTASQYLQLYFQVRHVVDWIQILSPGVHLLRW